MNSRGNYKHTDMSHDAFILIGMVPGAISKHDAFSALSTFRESSKQANFGENSDLVTTT